MASIPRVPLLLAAARRATQHIRSKCIVPSGCGYYTYMSRVPPLKKSDRRYKCAWVKKVTIFLRKSR